MALLMRPPRACNSPKDVRMLYRRQLHHRMQGRYGRAQPAAMPVAFINETVYGAADERGDLGMCSPAPARTQTF